MKIGKSVKRHAVNKKMKISGSTILLCFILCACSEPANNNEIRSSAILQQQRIMLYQLIAKIANDKDKGDIDVNACIVELYFPYYLHCKINNIEDKGIFEVIKKASSKTKGYNINFDAKKWNSIRSNPSLAGYDPRDIEIIDNLEKFKQITKMYNSDLR